jgi:autotransporter-associated beta strand protein
MAGTTGSTGVGTSIVDNAALVFNRSDNISFGGVISGSGSLAQAGPGMLTLTGANTYTGGTTISGGTLRVGAGGTFGSLGTGTITINNNGALIFNRSDAVTVSDAIVTTVPNGSLTQAGSGTLILTGANTYNGGTTIAAGTLQVGNGGTSGTLGSGGVVDNGALVFNRSDTFTVINAISGSGSLTQAGTGTLILNSSNTYSGTTTINSGGTLQVGPGGTNGTLGSGNIVDNGTLNFNHVDNISISNIVSGSGGLGQIGAGILTLTGANTYTGGTTNQRRHAGAERGWQHRHVQRRGRRRHFRYFRHHRLQHQHQGTDRRRKLGIGRQDADHHRRRRHLLRQRECIRRRRRFGNGGRQHDFDRTINAPVTVDSGAAIQIGNGGTAGSVNAPIAGTGTLIFNRSDNISLPVIDFLSKLNLTQAGSGTLTISNANAFNTVHDQCGHFAGHCLWHDRQRVHQQ